MRHGQTDANVFNIIAGQSPDMPLNNIGLKQAELTAEALSETPFNRVYTSPALRTRQTAKKIIESHKSLVLAETHLNLAEINFGILEGRTFDEIEESHPDLLRIYREKPSQCAFPGGESMTEAYERIGRTINTIIINHSHNESVLIVSHGGAIALVLLYLLNIDMDKTFHAIKHRNCSLSIIDLESSVWNFHQYKPQIICINDISYLKEEYKDRLNNLQ